MDIAELKSKSIAELHEMAEELQISNYSGLRKQDLIFRIEQNLLDSDVVLQRLVDAQGQPADDDTITRLTERLQRQERASLWLALHGAPVRIEPINSADVPRCFGYVARPAEPGSPP